MNSLKPEDFKIETLGEAKILNPLIKVYSDSGDQGFFVGEGESIYFNVYFDPAFPEDSQFSLRMEKAGPREKVFFNPSHTHAAIVTCGGLSPGLNNVIQSLVRTLWHNYGITRITGIQYGYNGFLSESGHSPVVLTPDSVDDIHKEGGTILGTSRGGGKIPEIVDSIQKMNINILFTIGGDGTQAGALSIAEEAERRGYTLAVVGIPKTVDNDLSYVQQSFGFATAVEKAVHCISGAHAEAKAAFNGIGIVKVMGRHSGFIAAHTALASTDVNFCLIPEVPFDLRGEKGLFKAVEDRLRDKQHLVILIAEGAGQELMTKLPEERDASGNLILQDVGIFLKNQLKKHLAEKEIPNTIKYIDPSYLVRSEPANAADSLYCSRLGANAVHAAIAGRNKVLISIWSNKYVHVPINLAVRERNVVKKNGSFWRDVLAMTRQPIDMKN